MGSIENFMTAIINLNYTDKNENERKPGSEKTEIRQNCKLF
jgi:hypothetical protein